MYNNEEIKSVAQFVIEKIEENDFEEAKAKLEEFTCDFGFALDDMTEIMPEEKKDMQRTLTQLDNVAGDLDDILYSEVEDFEDEAEMQEELEETKQSILKTLRKFTMQVV